MRIPGPLFARILQEAEFSCHIHHEAWRPGGGDPSGAPPSMAMETAAAEEEEAT